jgi:hypothetical protein
MESGPLRIFIVSCFNENRAGPSWPGPRLSKLKISHFSHRRVVPAKRGVKNHTCIYTVLILKMYTSRLKTRIIADEIVLTLCLNKLFKVSDSA